MIDINDYPPLFSEAESLDSDCVAKAMIFVKDYLFLQLN